MAGLDNLGKLQCLKKLKNQNRNSVFLDELEKKINEDFQKLERKNQVIKYLELQIITSKELLNINKVIFEFFIIISDFIIKILKNNRIKF